MSSKRLSIREKRKKQLNRQRNLTILAVVIVALVITFILIGPSIRDSLAPVGDIVVPTFSEVLNPDRNSMGDGNATVTVVEFSDFQCPGCKNFHDNVEDVLIEQYVKTGLVKFTYRSMGDWLGPESFNAAEAAYCAADQNKFWEFHKTLFANQGLEGRGSFADKRLKAMAQELGLDTDAFNSCYDGNQSQAEVSQDRADGQSAGVTATPSFVVNGKLVTIVSSYEELFQAIDAEIQAGQ